MSYWVLFVHCCVAVQQQWFLSSIWRCIDVVKSTPKTIFAALFLIVCLTSIFTAYRSSYCRVCVSLQITAATSVFAASNKSSQNADGSAKLHLKFIRTYCRSYELIVQMVTVSYGKTLADLWLFRVSFKKDVVWCPALTLDRPTKIVSVTLSR